MMNIGIVGHRYFQNPAISGFVADQCYRILADSRLAFENLRAISMLAEGADTIFAQAALDLCIPLEIIRPFRTYSGDFVDARALERYYRIRGMAKTETVLAFEDRSLEAYETAMKLVVARSDLLVAAWDGRPAQGPGGTGDAVRHAIAIDRSWIHIDTTRLTVFRYVSDSFVGLSNLMVEN